MNEIISEEKISHLIRDIPDDESAFIQEELEYYFPLWIGEKQKENFVKALHRADLDIIIGMIQINSISQNAIDKVKGDSLYCNALQIIESIIHEEDQSVENAVAFYDQRLDALVAMYETQIEQYSIAKLPKKKKKQVLALKSIGNATIAKQVLEDAINSAGFKWIEQIAELKRYLDRMKSDSNFDIRLFSPAGIKVNPSSKRKVAYALSYPDFNIRFLINKILSNETELPFDWYLRRNLSISEYERVINGMGENYQRFAKEQYDFACARIFKNASIPEPGIRKRKNLITEMIFLLSNGQTESARIISFVLIEGLLWEIVYTIDKKERFILSDDYKFSNLSGAEIQSNRIRDIVKQTVVSKYIDNDFVKHFCEELYVERNPVLHGSTQCYSCENAGVCLFGKMLVLDYLLEKLIGLHKNNLFAAWDEMPDDRKNRIMNSVMNNNNQEIGGGNSGDKHKMI